jgi:hypothetical protein
MARQKLLDKFCQSCGSEDFFEEASVAGRYTRYHCTQCDNTWVVKVTNFVPNGDHHEGSIREIEGRSVFFKYFAVGTLLSLGTLLGGLYLIKISSWFILIALVGFLWLLKVPFIASRYVRGKCPGCGEIVEGQKPEFKCWKCHQMLQVRTTRMEKEND